MCIRGVLLALLVSGACKREERGFRVDPPTAERAHEKSLTNLYPGTPNPPAPVINEYEENAYALSEGKTLFNKFNCSGCHGNGGGNIGPALMDEKWIYGSDPQNIYATILEGRPNGMPSFRGRIPNHQVWQLVAYVRSLSGLVPKDVANSRDDHMQYKKPEGRQAARPPDGAPLPKSAEGPQ